MITIRFSVVFLLVAGLAGCSADSFVALEPSYSADEPVVTPSEGTLNFQGLPIDKNPMSGEWAYDDGIKNCHGYLTRFEDEEFCSIDVPDDWIPFTFDGKRFYVQPLSEEASENLKAAATP